MKKLYLLILSLVLLVFAGCSKNVDFSSGPDLPDNIKNESVESLDLDSEAENLEKNESAELIIDSEKSENDESPVKVNIDEDTSIIVDSENSSVVVENKDNSASATLVGNDTIVVDTDLDIDVSKFEDVKLADWCISGQKVTKDVDGSSSVDFVISGIVDFKDEKYCLSEGTVTTGDLDVPALIYAKDLTSDFWLVIEFLGQTVEKKIQPNFK